MKRKVNDKVTIRSWDSMEKEFMLDSMGDIRGPESIFFNEEMSSCCGKTFKIIDIYAGFYRLDSEKAWGFCDWMFTDWQTKKEKKSRHKKVWNTVTCRSCGSKVKVFGVKPKPKKK